ncbi:MAG: glycosyltransferase family 39 protein [Elusimicrobia bacterium]|nr:glycosyltransferase family 39 protein [Elusimicrobiota bacterium]
MDKTRGRALFAGVFIAAWAVFVALGAGFIRSAAPTYDEPVHLASGNSVWAGARESLNYRNHPPFGEAWDALPLVFLKPLTFFSSPDWMARRLYHYGDLFLYKNIVPANKLMNDARLWSLASWGALLGFAILEWSLRLGGTEALVFAGLFFALCPPLISNAALVTTDAPAAAFYFLTFWILSFSPRRLRHWILAGACAGFGLASKFSLMVVPPLVLIGILTEMRLRKNGKKIPLAGLAGMAAAALFCLSAAYRFEGLGQYWAGLSATFSRLNRGRPTFLLGAYSMTGWWLYFPAALLVKTPIPELLFGALAAALWFRRPSLDRFWVLMPAIAYLCAAEFSKTQIGCRYVLPPYPFLLVAAAWGAAWLWRRGRGFRAIVAGLCAWFAFGTARAYPYYLSYFNEVAGGSAGGYRWLADSNLDWGQALPALAAYLRANGNPPIILSYFGSADPAYYGIRYIALGTITNVERAGDGVRPFRMKRLLFAISATNLDGVYYQDHQTFSWLERRKPIFVAGHAIFVYDLSGDAGARARLGRILSDNGDRRLAEALGLTHG